ncbi:MAG: hypothetical protein RL641_245 [Candidatus Parcubacteria bacterium]|jgi:hypothetical protein
MPTEPLFQLDVSPESFRSIVRDKGYHDEIVYVIMIRLCRDKGYPNRLYDRSEVEKQFEYILRFRKRLAKSKRPDVVWQQLQQSVTLRKRQRNKKPPE